VSDAAPVLEARGIVKRYGHVTALDGVDLDVGAGEILALIGDNGAGKSTLLKVLSGAIEPDAGEVRLADRPVRLRSPRDARRAGIETVYQDLALSPALDVASNLFLGRELRRGGLAGGLFRLLDERRMRREASRHLADLGIEVPSIGGAVENLSGGQRQGVAVARAAAWATRVVILDEPTAALGVRETAHVLALIARIRERGLAVVLVSHDMPHVFELADRIQVMRLGRRAATITPRTHTMADAVALMTGAMGGDASGASP
jgi:fructose transport system ATP-binding protein